MRRMPVYLSYRNEIINDLLSIIGDDLVPNGHLYKLRIWLKTLLMSYAEITALFDLMDIVYKAYQADENPYDEGEKQRLLAILAKTSLIYTEYHKSMGDRSLTILPETVFENISENLAPGTLLRLSETNHFFNKLSFGRRLATDIIELIKNPDFNREKYSKLLNASKFPENPVLLTPILLHHVAYGQQDEAEEILRKYPNLIFAKGDVTDYSGRTFKNISPIMLADWYHDSHIKTMMLQMLTPSQIKAIVPLIIDDEPSDFYMDYAMTIQGYLDSLPLKTLQLLHEHLQELDKYPERFSHHGTHYDVSLLADAYQLYLDFFDNGNPYGEDKDQVYYCWEKVIGGQQRYVPAHLAQEQMAMGPEYKFDLNVLPNRFKEQYLPRNGKVWVDNLWYPLSVNSGLGFKFGYSRGNQNFTYRVQPTTEPTYLDPAPTRRDKYAISRLCMRRAEESNLMRNLLEIQLSACASCKSNLRQ